MQDVTEVPKDRGCSGTSECERECAGQGAREGERSVDRGGARPESGNVQGMAGAE